jgi:hypothetical protein
MEDNMPTDAVAYPRLKEFKFRVEINGYPAALVSEFDPGTESIGVTEHAGAGQNHSVKEGGMIKFGNAILKGVVPLFGPGGTYFYDWLTACQDAATGNGGPPATYYRNFSMYELDPAGNPARTWEFVQGFIAEYKLGNRNSLSQDKDVIEEVDIAYTSRTQRVA